MVSPVNPANANHISATEQLRQRVFAGRTWFPLLRGDPLLSREQTSLIRSMSIIGISLSLLGLTLFSITVPLSDSGFISKLMDPEYRVISSLRFPSLILGISTLYCAKITSTYLKKTNENQAEISPKLMHEIEERVKTSIQISLQSD